MKLKEIREGEKNNNMQKVEKYSQILPSILEELK